MPSALEGMRVVDLTRQITGPFCTKLLADYGADVVKVEQPGVGDPARRLGPFFEDTPGLERSGLFLHLNTNKRSVTIDLKEPDGRNALLELVAGADVVVESFSPRVLPGLGLDYPALRAVKPDLVMASISNFGQTGPYRDYKMSELTMFAMSGTMHSNGLPRREPVKLAITVQQIFAGMLCASAVAGAAVGRERNGGSVYLDLSLFEIMASHQDRGLMAMANYQYTGANPQRRGDERPDLTPASAYRCADGYIQAFALNQTWRATCELIGRPELIDDPHFVAPENFTDNAEVRAEFLEIWHGWLASHTKQEIMERGQSIGFIVGAANTMESAFADRQFAARGFFVEVEHPVTGALRYPGAPFQMSATPWRAGRAPLLGEHTDEVLREVGYDDARLAELHKSGVLG